MVTAPYGRVLREPRGSFFLFGPRGTGKSTWLRQAFPRARRFDLLDEALYQSLLAQPSLLGDELRTLKSGSWVVLDEVQRLPGLLNEAHRFMEERRLRFVLCGSSARKLRTSGVNLLAGRAVRRELFPFVPEELGSDFDLGRALRFGTLPIVTTAPEPAETLTAYAQLYLREEIQAEALVRNLAGFARFLPVAALFHGQTINAAAVARDCGVARTTVLGYLSVLEDTLMTFQVPAYEGALRVRERKHPKLYWADPGIVRAIKRQLGPVSIEERGRLFEGWIASVLRAYGSYRGLFDTMSYWSPADATGTEVDFVLQRGSGALAVEAKSSPRVDGGMLRGLRAIAPLKGLERRILVYSGERRLRTKDGIDILPVAEFLGEIAGGSLWRGR
jgi:uncharacterized protein